MALVPSGHLKIMEAQTFGKLGKLSQLTPEAQKQTAPQARPEIEQQQLGVQSPPAAQTTPTQEVASDQIPPAPQGEQSPSDQVPGMIGKEEPAKQEHEESGPSSDIQAAFEQILQGLGVEERQIASVRGQIFKETTDLNTGSTQGYYLLPTYTVNGKVERKKALEVAQKLGRQFGLAQTLENEPVKGKGVVNWKIHFKSQPKQETQRGGSSFDSMMGEGQSKAASTIGEMIKARKNEVYETMRQIAQGAK